MAPSRSHERELLAILFDYAPTGSAQDVCVQRLHQAQQAMRNRNKTTKECIRETDILLVGMLLDGLQHGNWPWT